MHIFMWMHGFEILLQYSSNFPLFWEEWASSGEEKFGARTLVSGRLLAVRYWSNSVYWKALSLPSFKLVRLLIGFSLMKAVSPVWVLHFLSFCFTWLFLFLPLSKASLPAIPKYFCSLLTPYRCRVHFARTISEAGPFYFIIFKWLWKPLREMKTR